MTRLLNLPQQFNRYLNMFESTTFMQISEYVWKFFLLIIGLLVIWLHGFWGNGLLFRVERVG